MSGPEATPSRPSPADLLPPELDAFLGGGAVQTLLVRGAPGVGKTSFALGALAAFPGARIFLTSRVSSVVLRRQFPWLRAPSTPPIEIVDLLRLRRTTPDLGLSVEELRQSLQARASDLVDVSQVVNLPAALTAALARDRAPVRLIAIDSWDAYVENVLGSASIGSEAPTTRWELERSMLDELLATGASVLLVVERDERTRLDYLVDGALRLTAAEVEGREERWLEIGKLRGVRIRSRTYPFTLEGARFRALFARSAVPHPSAPADPDPEPQAPELWPGSAAFGAQFGRLPLLGPLLLETDAETPARAVWRLVLPMIESALADHGRVLVRPPLTLPSTDLWSAWPHPESAEPLAASLRIVGVAGPGRPPEVPPEVFLPPEEAPPGPTDGFSPGAKLALEFLESSLSSRNLAVIFPPPPEDPGAPHGSLEYVRLLGQARRDGAHFASVVVVGGADPALASARVRAPVHLGVRTRRGQLFVFGIRPWGPSFLVDTGGPGSDVRGPYELRAMV